MIITGSVLGWRIIEISGRDERDTSSSSKVNDNMAMKMFQSIQLICIDMFVLNIYTNLMYYIFTLLFELQF